MAIWECVKSRLQYSARSECKEGLSSVRKESVRIIHIISTIFSGYKVIECMFSMDLRFVKCKIAPPFAGLKL